MLFGSEDPRGENGQLLAVERRSRRPDDRNQIHSLSETELAGGDAQDHADPVIVPASGKPIAVASPEVVIGDLAIHDLPPRLVLVETGMRKSERSFSRRLHLVADDAVRATPIIADGNPHDDAVLSGSIFLPLDYSEKLSPNIHFVYILLCCRNFFKKIRPRTRGAWRAVLGGEGETVLLATPPKGRCAVAREPSVRALPREDRGLVEPCAHEVRRDVSQITAQVLEQVLVVLARFADCGDDLAAIQDDRLTGRDLCPRRDETEGILLCRHGTSWWA